MNRSFRFFLLGMIWLAVQATASFSHASDPSQKVSQCSEVFLASQKSSGIKDMKQKFIDWWQSWRQRKKPKSIMFPEDSSKSGNRSRSHSQNEKNQQPDSRDEESYQASNVDTDRPQDSSQSPESRNHIVSQFYLPHEMGYYVDKNYRSINAHSFIKEKTVGTILPWVPHPVQGAQVIDILLNPSLQRSYLKIPFGYRAKGYQVAANGVFLEAAEYVKLIQGNDGLYLESFQSLLPGQSVLRLYLEKVPAEIISTNERKQLTFVKDAISVDEFPQAWSVKIRELQVLYSKGKVDSVQLADFFSDWIDKNSKYQVDKNETQGILEFCRSGRFQCSGAALILAHILRAHFQIPSYVASGALGSYAPEKPEISLLLSGAEPHAFVVVYSEREKTWQVVDPTPSEATRPKKNQQQDPRFRNRSASQSSEKKDSNSKLSKDSELEKKSGSDQDAATERLNLWKKFFQQDPSHMMMSDLQDLQNHFTSLGHISKSKESDDLQILLRLSQWMGTDQNQEFNQWIKTGRDPEKSRQNFLRWKWFSLLSDYGVKYAEGSDRHFYQKLKKITQQIGNYLQLHGTVQKPEDVFVAELPGEFTRQAYLSGLISKERAFQIASLWMKTKLLRERRMGGVGILRRRQQLIQTDNYDLGSRIAEDFDRQEFFLRDGRSPKYDALRIALGEMEEQTFLQDEIDPHVPRPLQSSPHRRPLQEDTYLLVDLSGSNDREEGVRGFIRDLMVQSSIDEVMSLNAQARLHIIGYRTQIDFHNILKTRDQAQDYFQKMLSMQAKASYFSNSGGNNLEEAMRYLFQIIGSAATPATKVNVRVFTDGADRITSAQLSQLIAEARKKLQSKPAKDGFGSYDFDELNLTAATFVEGNPNLKEFITTQHQGRANFGSAAPPYQFLSLTDAQSISSGKDGQELLETADLIPENQGGWLNIPPYIWSQLEKNFVTHSSSSQ